MTHIKKVLNIDTKLKKNLSVTDNPNSAKMLYSIKSRVLKIDEENTF